MGNQERRLQRGQSSGSSNKVCCEQLGDQEDKRERVRLFTKLMSVYPTKADNEDMMLWTLIDLTRDIPAPILSRGLGSLMKQEGRKWMPVPNEIREASAKAVLYLQGRLPKLPEYNGWVGWDPLPQIDVEKEIRSVREFLPPSTLALMGSLDSRVKVLAAKVSQGKALQGRIDGARERVQDAE